MDATTARPRDEPLCALCLERTRGRAARVRLGYGVEVWLCAGHADPAYQVRRSGHDFVTALERVWRTSGCLTMSRQRALAAHLESLRARPSLLPRPGSHGWPAVRREAERLYARGLAPAEVAGLMGERFSSGHERPSASTFIRWHAERRWMTAEAARGP